MKQETINKIKRIAIIAFCTIFLILFIIEWVTDDTRSSKAYHRAHSHEYESYGDYYYAYHKPDYIDRFENSKARENLDDNAHGYFWENP